MELFSFLRNSGLRLERIHIDVEVDTCDKWGINDFRQGSFLSHELQQIKSLLAIELGSMSISNGYTSLSADPLI